MKKKLIIIYIIVSSQRKENLQIKLVIHLIKFQTNSQFSTNVKLLLYYTKIKNTEKYQIIHQT